jgi:hypothetical protein
LPPSRAHREGSSNEPERDRALTRAWKDFQGLRTDRALARAAKDEGLRSALVT